MSLTKFVGLLAGTAMAGSAFAASVEANTDAMAQIAELKKELAEMKAQSGDKWLNDQRAAEIRSVVQDVLSDTESRASLQSTQATSGYNNGFFISSPDGNFKLTMNGQAQARWAYNWLSTRDMDNSSTAGAAAPGNNFNTQGVTKAAYGFEIRRAKLEFGGHIADPSWQYAVTIAYQQFFGSNTSPAAATNPTGGGISQGDNFAGTFGLENAYILKDMGNGMSFQVGQFKSPFLREWLVSSKYQLAVERSLVSTLFSTGWTQGVQLNWHNDNLRAMVSYNDGANNANLGSISGTNDGGALATNQGVGFTQWAFTGRAEFMASGNWAQFDKLTSMRGEGSGLLVGAGLNWQRGGQQTSTAGGFANNVAGNGNADAMFLSWTVDATWQLGGANLYGAWVMNTTSGQPGGLNSANSYGAIIQGGYFITDAIELFARWEWMSTATSVDATGASNVATGDVSTNFATNAFVNNIGTVGANWYFSKNVKFTTDFGVSWNPVTFQTGLFGQNISGADYRTEGANGGGQLVFRTQMQVTF